MRILSLCTLVITAANWFVAWAWTHSWRFNSKGLEHVLAAQGMIPQTYHLPSSAKHYLADSFWICGSMITWSRNGIAASTAYRSSTKLNIESPRNVRALRAAALMKGTFSKHGNAHVGSTRLNWGQKRFFKGNIYEPYWEIAWLDLSMRALQCKRAGNCSLPPDVILFLSGY